MIPMTSNAILDTLSAHVFQLDGTGNILEYRPSIHLQGHPLPTENNSNITTLLAADISQLYMDKIAQLKQTGHTVHFHYCIETDGRQHCFIVHCAKQGATYIFILMAAPKTLACDNPNSAEVLATALDTVPAAIFWKNRDSIYLGCNSRFAHDVGLESPEQLIGKCDRDLLWNDHADEFNDEDRNVINSGVAMFNHEKTITGADGQAHILKISKLPLLDRNRQIIGILGVYEDVTEKKQHKEEKRIFYERIRKTKKMEALVHLTSGIAHDFNNILASILGYADLTLDSLMEMDNQEELVRYISEVIAEGEKARDLITQMLAFARTDPSEDIALNPVPLIKEIVKVTQTSLPDNIKLSINADAEIPKILIDPSKLHQAILSLCINARDALADRNGHIIINVNHVTCYQSTCQSCNERFDGEFVEISVADDGEGIDAFLLDQIFDPFFSTRETNINRGMGLATVHGILHEHHGHIMIDSISNYGATIRLLLPPAHSLQKNSTSEADMN